MSGNLPDIDQWVHERLATRFGSDVEPWFEELPVTLNTLGDRWNVRLTEQIPRGSVSVVFRCVMADGRRAILKTSPDKDRLLTEATALSHWSGRRTPAVSTCSATRG